MKVYIKYNIGVYIMIKTYTHIYFIKCSLFSYLIRGDLFVIDKLWYLDIINHVGVLN